MTAIIWQHGDRVLRIDWYHVTSYFDRPFSGWLRAGGRYRFFDLCEDGDEPSRWDVFDVPRAVRVQYLLDVRRFRRLVGWHWDFDPDGGRREWFFDEARHPHWRRFYETRGRPAGAPPGRRLIGRTADLRTITLDEALLEEEPGLLGSRR